MGSAFLTFLLLQEFGVEKSSKFAIRNIHKISFFLSYISQKWQEPTILVISMTIQ